MTAYLLSLTAFWTLGLVAYAALLRPLACHGFNRAFLLAVLVGGGVVPLTPDWVGLGLGGDRLATIALPEVAAGGPIDDAPAVARGATGPAVGFPWARLAWCAYAAGLTIALMRHLQALAWLRTRFGESRTLPDGEPYGLALYTADRPGAPFAIGRRVWVGRWAALPEPERRAILLHEREHARRWHTADLALAAAATTALWCHPLAYVLRRELRRVHEFEADAAVVVQVDPAGYRALLLRHQLRMTSTLSHHLAGSPLQNRFDMMTNAFRQNQRWRLAVAAALLCSGGLACTKEDVGETDAAPEYMTLAELNAAQHYGRVTATGDLADARYRIEQRTVDDGGGATRRVPYLIVKLPNGEIATPMERPERAGGHGAERYPAPAIDGAGEVFRIVERMPRYPGCDDEVGDDEARRACAERRMLEHLYGGLRYPSAARAAGVEGKVIVSFVVEPDGTLTNAHVLRSPSDALAAEALRVIETFPRWEPGRQRGEAVRASFTLPIAFRLEG